jgi:PQQ-like domain
MTAGCPKCVHLGQYRSLKWYYTDPNYWVVSSPAIGADGSIYFGDAASIVALNPDGSLKWEIYTHEEFPVSSPAIGADGTIYAGANDGNIYAVSPDGSIKWKFFTHPVTIVGPGRRSVQTERSILKCIPIKPRDDEQHPADSLLCVFLQRAWDTNCGRRSLSHVRLTPESHYRERRDEPQLRVSDC